jgi:signal peptidase I
MITLFMAVLIITFAFFLIVRFTLMDVIVISQSMSPTIEKGDRVLALRFWPTRWLHVGQIVLFRPPEGYSFPHFEIYGMLPLIKRIVGLPGDRCKVTFRFSSSCIEQDLRSEEFTIPPAHFVVRGDWEIAGSPSLTMGPIPYDNLLAMVVMKLPRGDHRNFRRGITPADIDETRLV